MSNNIINYNIISFLQKKFVKGFKSTGGRNFLGRICVKGRGLCSSSKKNIYRYIDFYRRINQQGILLNIYYDPNRTSKIGLLLYENGLSTFALLQKGIPILSYIYSGNIYNNFSIKKGDSLLIKDIPLFSIISNIENKPYNGGSYCRAAGVSGLLISKDKWNSIIKLNSGWQLNISSNCISSYGIISSKWNNRVIGKAGKNRALGKKSKVRGVAMNPCDHPHGGGNGKRSKPSRPVNAWNTVFKWTPTKKKNYQLSKKRIYKEIIRNYYYNYK